MSITLRQLEAFVQAFHSGSLTAAAEQLQVTTPAASMLIKQLEEELGLALFDRGARGLQPTEMGQQAIAWATQALDARTQLDNLASARHGLARGQLRVAASPAIAALLLPPVIRRFRERHPGVKLLLDDASPAQLDQRVATGEVELALGTPDAHVDPRVECARLIRDQLSVICRTGDALALAETVAWSELAGLCVVTVRSGHGIRTLVNEALATSGVQLELAFEVTLFTTALAMAAQGLGLALLPSFLLTFAPQAGLVARPLHTPTVTRDIALMTCAGRALSPAAAAFAELVRTQLGD